MKRRAKALLFSRAIFQKEYPFCIICTANPAAKYPVISFEGKPILAHRLSYETYKGKIGIGMEVDHWCFNTRCINPGHLSACDPITNYERAMKQPGGWHRGERNGAAKLTEEQVREIKHLLRTTALTQREIATRYGVDHTTISKINSKENWSHIM